MTSEEICASLNRARKYASIYLLLSRVGAGSLIVAMWQWLPVEHAVVTTGVVVGSHVSAIKYASLHASAQSGWIAWGLKRVLARTEESNG